MKSLSESLGMRERKQTNFIIASVRAAGGASTTRGVRRRPQKFNQLCDTGEFGSGDLVSQRTASPGWPSGRRRRRWNAQSASCEHGWGEYWVRGMLALRMRATLNGIVVSPVSIDCEDDSRTVVCGSRMLTIKRHPCCWTVLLQFRGHGSLHNSRIWANSR